MKHRLNWNNYNNIIIKHKNKKPKNIFIYLIQEANKRKDEYFLNNLTLEKVRWQIDNLKKRGLLKIDNNLKKKIEKDLLSLEIETIKKQKQNLFLRKNFREEGTINTVRNSIIKSLNDKVNKKEGYPEEKININKTSNENCLLQHIITDIHLNEIVTRKDNMNNWSTEIGLKDFEKVINHIIEKIEKEKVEKVELLFLGDLIGTTIHEGLELDVEPIRAATLLASAITQAFYELKKYVKEVTIVLVPGNHSENRKYGNKTDVFHENYDFLVGERVKEFLSITGNEKYVYSPNRDIPLIAKNIGKEKHGFIHGDRFGSKMKNILPILEEYYNFHYLDYLHQGHFHTEQILFTEDVLKFTYPCFCQPSSYGLNRIGVTQRERQIGNIYDKEGNLVKTYSIKIEDKVKKEKFKLKFNINNDLYEIFKETISIK